MVSGLGAVKLVLHVCLSHPRLLSPMFCVLNKCSPTSCPALIAPSALVLLVFPSPSLMLASRLAFLFRPLLWLAPTYLLLWFIATYDSQPWQPPLPVGLTSPTTARETS